MTGRLALPPRAARSAIGLAILTAATIVCCRPVALPLLANIALILVLAWITWRDATTLTIPDGAVLALAFVAVILRWPDVTAAWDGAGHAALDLLVEAAVPGLALLAFREMYFRRRGFDGLGLGDVKLGFAGGLLIGPLGFSWALTGASAAALLFVASRLGKASAPRDKVAFGAVLAPAIGVVWLSQQWSAAGPFGSG